MLYQIDYLVGRKQSTTKSSQTWTSGTTRWN